MYFPDFPLLGKRWRTHFIQRWRWGFDDSDTWSLNHTCAKWLAPRLRRFKDVNIGHPCFMTMKEWEGELDKMIYALEKTAEGHWEWGDDWRDIDAKIEEGFILLGKYWGHLWW